MPLGKSCDLCFEVTKNMRCHMREAHEDLSESLGFLCHQCDSFCSSLTDIIRHKCAGELNPLPKSKKINNVKKIVKKGLKQIVPKSVKSVLTRKIKRQSSSKSCDICFFKTQNLNNHMKSAHESPEEVPCFSCSDCGKVFSGLTDSVKHKCSDQIEKGSNFQDFFGFSDSKELLLWEKPLIKSDPEEVNTSGDVLDEFAENRGKHGKNFTNICNICKDGFEGTADLMRHRSLKHRFPCEICFNKFPLMLTTHHDAKSLEEGWLQSHMRTTHTL